MKKVVDEEGRLAAAHARAEVELAAASADAGQQQEAFDDVQADLRKKQRRHAVWSGQEKGPLPRGANPAALKVADGAWLQGEIQRLWGVLHERDATLKAAQARLEGAAKAEREAFYALHEHRQRTAVVESLRLQVLLFAAMKQERQAREAMAAREGVPVGTRPIFASAYFARCDTRDPQSQLCRMIRDAVALDWLTGQEEWLSGVAWC